MFSRFKKPDDASARPAVMAPVTSAGPAAARAAPATATQAALAARPLPAAPAPRPPAEAVAADKEKKRKDRLQELKVELHKRLLENLNLAALEHASENNLKQERVETDFKKLNLSRFEIITNRPFWSIR